MVAMKSATENAGEMIKQLSMTYNRARQSQITGDTSWTIIGGVELNWTVKKKHAN